MRALIVALVALGMVALGLLSGRLLAGIEQVDPMGEWRRARDGRRR